MLRLQPQWLLLLFCLTPTVQGSNGLLWTETQAEPMLTRGEWQRSPNAGKVVHFDMAAVWRGEQATIQLPNGGIVRLTQPQLTPNANGTTSYAAHFNNATGVLRLVINQRNRVHGFLHDGFAHFVIEPLQSGQHLLKGTSDQKFPSCSALDLPITDYSPASGPGAEGIGDPAQTSQLDLLIVITETLAAQHSDLDGFVQLAFDVTNETFANSAVNARVNLVHTMIVDYPDPNEAAQAFTDLYRNGNGVLDEVHTARDEYGADLISFWLSDIGSTCGQAFVNTRNDPNGGFNTVAGPCVIDNLSFPHELGHNLGAVHDRTNSSRQGMFPYAYGFQKPGHFRTVMAYYQGCECPRVMHFSNPNVLYQDQPTGVPTEQSDSADNALTFNQTRLTVSRFREPPCPGATITSQPQGATFCTGGSLLLSITAEGEDLQYQWFRHQVAIEGATSAELPLNNLDSNDAGRYHCQVTNACTTTPSVYAELSVFNGGEVWPEWPTNNVLDIIAILPADCF